MPRIGDRAALAIFLILSGGTVMGLGMTSVARSTKKKETASTVMMMQPRKETGSDFNSRLKSLDT